ncbi:ATP-binding cassette domain-containing protein [Natronorarus salvus]|uniref:ATP-binding cassette domain-containing protein n=1 Tax=Natronorarus salvus TaxID=3117733 RepID=UPI002F26B849
MSERSRSGRRVVDGNGAESSAMIDVEEVDVSLGGVTVLSAVSASVGEGTFVGFVGPNGAGKSTLLRTIAGVLAPAAGRVLIDGTDVHALSAREAGKRVAVVPQDTSLSFAFDVRDVVAMGRTPYRGRLRTGDPVGRERVEWALSRTETGHLADRSISDVSGGERQRVVLARALAQDAPVLLLDEPTSSLDINHQLRTLELVSELVSEGKTVIAAIHDLNLAAHYCEEIVVLSDGRVLESGPPGSVLTEGVVEAAFDTRAVVTRHPVTGSTYVTAVPERPPKTGAHVHVIGGGGVASRLLYLLSGAGYEVTVGALNEGDSDLETARSLGLEAVSIEPFSPVDGRTKESVSTLIDRAEVTVIADVEVGIGNLPNLDCARGARSVVVVEERPFEERNYTGPEGRAIYDALRERGRVVGESELLSAVGSAVEPEREL